MLKAVLPRIYFRIEHNIHPGPTDWLLRNIDILKIKKPGNHPNVAEVITKDMSVTELYGDILSTEELRQDVDRELST